MRTLDEASGVWRDEPKTLAPVAGYDLVFSCPKSVSLLHALTGDEDVRRRDLRRPRGGLAGGALLPRGRGLRGAPRPRRRDPRARRGLRRRRLPPPHQPRPGPAPAHPRDRRQPGALARRRLAGARRRGDPRTYRLAAGYLYEAQLRHELSRALGVRWTEPVKGMAEIEGVPLEAIRAFSTRRQSLVEHMEAMGTSGFAASRVAALATRERKEAIDLPDLRESWLARAAEMGLGAIELRGLLEREPARGSCRRSTADDLTAHQTTVTTPELVRAVAGAARDGASVEAVLAGVERDHAPARAHPGRRRPDARAGRRASRRGASSSSSARRSSSRSRPRRGRPAPPRRSGRAARPERPRLALRRAAGARRGDGALARPSRLRGAAPPAPARRPRCRSSATPSCSQASRCSAPRRAAEPPTSWSARPTSPRRPSTPCWPMPGARAAFRQGCVLVIDEAGMAETRVLGAGPDARRGGRRQGAPGRRPGPASRRRRRRPLRGALRAPRRRAPRSRTAASASRSSARRWPASAPATPRPTSATPPVQGRLLVADDATQAKQQLLADWWRRPPKATCARRVMLAHRRADVRDLNEGAGP